MGNVWDMSDSLYTTKIDLRNFDRAAGGGGGGRVDGGCCYELYLFCNLSWRSDV